MSVLRGVLAGLLGLALSACAATAEPGAAHPALTLDGKIEQGSVIRGTAMPGAQVTLAGKPLMVDGEGRFVFGFDRDATGDEELAITWPNGDTETRKLTIAPRAYDIQRINGLPEKVVTPPPEALAEIKREVAEKLAARKPDTQGSWFAENFIWPAKGPISGVFGSQRILNGEPKSPHYGVDVAARAGSPIVAPAGGIVTLAEPNMYFEGGLVFIDHGQGLISYMMHMSKVEVHKGDVVKQGEEIGRVGQTGRATGPHVHWGMYWLGAHVDPELLVPPMQQ